MSDAGSERESFGIYECQGTGHAHSILGYKHYRGLLKVFTPVTGIALTSPNQTCSAEPSAVHSAVSVAHLYSQPHHFSQFQLRLKTFLATSVTSCLALRPSCACLEFLQQ